MTEGCERGEHFPMEPVEMISAAQWSGDWCAYHCRDERYAYWMACGECLHAYRWPASLWWANLSLRVRLNLRGGWRLWGLVERPSRVRVCPLCAHDF